MPLLMANGAFMIYDLEVPLLWQISVKSARKSGIAFIVPLLLCRFYVPLLK
jgi:hypothetical protein